MERKTRSTRNETSRARKTVASEAVNGRMITLARESRGLTQKTLAERLGVTQGWLSKAETGVGGVSRDALRGLARALAYPERLFLQRDTIYGVGVSEIYYRRRQSVNHKTLNTVEASVNIRAMQIKRLLQGVDIGVPDFHPAEVSEFRSGAAEIAELVRAQWMLPGGPVQSVTLAIENAGGIVIPFDFGDTRIDALSFYPPELPPLFFARPDAPVDRLRFSLCHELGHVIMHRGFPGADAEKQADVFAASFLMPAREIRPYLRDISLAKLAALKPVWMTSMKALLKRAEDLGTITQRKARSLHAELAPYGIVEPVQIERHSEVPQMLREISNTYRGNLRYSLGDFAKVVMLDEDEAKQTYFPEDLPRLRIVR